MSTTTITPIGNYGWSRWVVSATLGQGTHQTIAAATASASSGDTIFIRNGTYTEDFTAKAGVTYTSFPGSELTPGVTIIGKITYTDAGTVTFANVRIQTNSDFVLVCSGGSSCQVNIDSCYLNFTNNTGISFTNSNAASNVNINYCYGNLGTTGITYVVSSSAGSVNIDECFLKNTGLSTVASSASAGSINYYDSIFYFPITTTSTATLSSSGNVIDTQSLNVTCLTANGTGNSGSVNDVYLSGSASTISVGAGAILLIYNASISTSNTNAITGAGTAKYALISYESSGSNINATTQSVAAQGPSAVIGSANTGASNTLTVANSSNTASSLAGIICSTAGSTAGDPYYQSTTTTTTWTWGADNSVTSPTADPFVISQGTTLGTNNVMSVATSGEINYPLQPSFSAYKSAQTDNVTGNSTAYTFVCDTEIFDQNSDYNAGTGVFTAPVTGRYMLGAGAFLTGCTINTTCITRLVTSNRTYENDNLRPAGAQNNTCYNVRLTDMDAADTCTTVVLGIGEVADTDDLFGTTSPITFFYGYLQA